MKGAVKILIGLLMLITVVTGYAPTPQYLVEFTCISNAFGGLLLTVDGILNLKGKQLPFFLYSNAAAGIFFVFLFCLGSFSGLFNINYSGAFFFLHAVNPVLFILCYIIADKDVVTRTWKRLLVTPGLVMAYLLFDYILGNYRGYFVYRFFEPAELKLLYAVLIVTIVYLIILLLGWALLALNHLVYKNSGSKTTTVKT